MKYKAPDNLKHYFLMKARRRFVPENHLIPVFKDGRFTHFLSSGYHRPPHWDESYGRAIPLSIRTCVLEVANTRSADGMPFVVNLRILYKFDPRKINVPEIKSNFVRADNHTIKVIMLDEAEKAVRHVFGTYESKDLCKGTILTQLQRKVRLQLLSTRDKFGFLLVTDTPVAITAIKAPKQLEQKTQQVTGLNIVSDSLRGLSAEETTQLLWADFLQKLENYGGSLHLLTPDFASLSANQSLTNNLLRKQHYKAGNGANYPLQPS